MAAVVLVGLGMASPDLARASPLAVHEFKESLRVHGALLRGTLELPSSAPPFPVVLIIGGSGPINQNGNDISLGLDTNCYKLLAQALARRGIASLRYDKLSVSSGAQAVAAERQLRFSTLIQYAVKWGHWLRASTRFSSLIIVGHSQGSLVGMVAARRLRAQAFISLDGAGEPIQQLLLSQLQPMLPPDYYARAKYIIQQLKQGHITQQVPPLLEAVFRPSVQPFLISWMHYDPATEIAKLKMPVLIVQGKRDLQVPIANARALENADPSATLVMIPTMNHVLKDVGPSLTSNRNAYRNPSLPISGKLVTRVSWFIVRLKKLHRRKYHAQ